MAAAFLLFGGGEFRVPLKRELLLLFYCSVRLRLKYYFDFELMSNFATRLCHEKVEAGPQV